MKKLVKEKESTADGMGNLDEKAKKITTESSAEMTGRSVVVGRNSRRRPKCSRE